MDVWNFLLASYTFLYYVASTLGNAVWKAGTGVRLSITMIFAAADLPSLKVTVTFPLLPRLRFAITISSELLLAGIMWLFSWTTRQETS